jgi:hypothetical protein
MSIIHDYSGKKRLMVCDFLTKKNLKGFVSFLYISERNLTTDTTDISSHRRPWLHTHV